MKKIYFLLALLLLTTKTSSAVEVFNSEISHFAGNALIASISTIVIVKWCPKIKKPALMGFFISSAEVILTETLAKTLNDVNISAIDMASGIAGAAFGAYLTEKWYVRPRIIKEQKHSCFGLVVGRTF